MTTVLKIGIASPEYMRDWTIAVARGEIVAAPDHPKIWFSSLESFAQVLSGSNRLLLELIRRAKPASLKELAGLSGRQQSNLNRTLHTMERYRLVRLTKKHGRVVPEVPYDKLELELPLAA
jgi:predicted transcriptional regulator